MTATEVLADEKLLAEIIRAVNGATLKAYASRRQAAWRAAWERRPWRSGMRPTLSERDWEIVQDESLTCTEVAKRIGKHKATVAYHRRKLGLPTTKYRGWGGSQRIEPTPTQMPILLNLSLTDADVAEVLSVGITTARKLRLRAGAPAGRPGLGRQHAH